MTVANVGAVRIAQLIGKRVMLAVIGHPRDDRTLDRARAENRQHRSDRAGGLERTMGEQTMEAHRHAETGEHVQEQEHEDVVPTQQAVPQLPANEEQAQNRDRSHDAGDDLIAALVNYQLNVGGNDR